MNVRRVSFLGVLVALAVALHLLEAQIPAPLPWVRLGLGNVMTLVAVVTLGWRSGVTVAVVKVVVGSLLFGGLLNPAFVLALGGSLASALVMAAMAPGVWRFWSPLAASAAGALAHGAAQVLLVAALLVRSSEAFLLLPWVLLPALASGVATGLLANLVLLRFSGYVRTLA